MSTSTKKSYSKTAVRPPVATSPHSLLTIKDVSGVIRMQPPWVYSELRAGRFPEPAIREPRFTRWTLASIEAWIIERSSGPKSTAGIERGKKAGDANAARLAEIKRAAAADSEGGAQ
jgi:predicted DNA-binding transcriptional regulator AlpA